MRERQAPARGTAPTLTTLMRSRCTAIASAQSGVGQSNLGLRIVPLLKAGERRVGESALKTSATEFRK